MLIRITLSCEEASSASSPADSWRETKPLAVTVDGGKLTLILPAPEAAVALATEQPVLDNPRKLHLVRRNVDFTACGAEKANRLTESCVAFVPRCTQL